MAPSIAATSAAAAGVAIPADYKVSVTNASGKDAWPIASFTYLLVHEDAKDKAKGDELVKFLWWAIHDGQATAAPLEYAPLPAPVVKMLEKTVQDLKVQGKPVPVAARSSNSGASAALPTPARAGNPGDRAWGWGITIFGGSLLVVAGLILLELGRVAAPAWGHLGLAKFLLSSDWDPVQEKFGALPFIYGTLVTSGVALAHRAAGVGRPRALPLRDGAAGAPVPVAFSIEVLAAIPSVVYGLWGLFVLVPWLRTASSPSSRGRWASSRSSRGRPSGSATWPPA